MQFGVATIGFVTKPAPLRGRCNKQYVYGVLQECSTVLRGLSAEWHYYRLSEIPNKYRNSLSGLQTQTRKICPKYRHILISAFQCSSIGGSYLEIMTGLGQCLIVYVVWQKINETDFLLSMNFILFTNQRHPLQNTRGSQKVRFPILLPPNNFT